MPSSEAWDLVCSRWGTNGWSSSSCKAHGPGWWSKEQANKTPARLMTYLDSWHYPHYPAVISSTSPVLVVLFHLQHLVLVSNSNTTPPAVAQWKALVSWSKLPTWLCATPAALGSASPGSKFFIAAISWSRAYLRFNSFTMGWLIMDDCMVGIEMNWAIGRNQHGALVALVSKLPWSLGSNSVWTREPPYLLRPWATFRSSTRQGPPMPGRKFRKNWNSYNKSMAHRSVFEMHKQWRGEAVRCINKWANGCKWWLRCQWNDIKESMHNWPNEPMNQWIGGKEWTSESMKQWINEPMTQSQGWLWGRFRATPSIAVFYIFYVK